MAAYAAAPHQAAFVPPAAVELPAAHEIPDRGDDASGEPPPDMLERSPDESPGDEQPAEETARFAGAVYGADGRVAPTAGATTRVSLLAY